jgi:hypothetical protein
MPMPFVERVMADKLIEQRREAVEKDRRRVEAYRRAVAEAESTGSERPIQEFMWELRREWAREDA